MAILDGSVSKVQYSNVNFCCVQTVLLVADHRRAGGNCGNYAEAERHSIAAGRMNWILLYQQPRVRAAHLHLARTIGLVDGGGKKVFIGICFPRCGIGEFGTHCTEN